MMIMHACMHALSCSFIAYYLSGTHCIQPYYSLTIYQDSINYIFQYLWFLFDIIAFCSKMSLIFAMLTAAAAFSVSVRWGFSAAKTSPHQPRHDQQSHRSEWRTEIGKEEVAVVLASTVVFHTWGWEAYLSIYLSIYLSYRLCWLVSSPR